MRVNNLIETSQYKFHSLQRKEVDGWSIGSSQEASLLHRVSKPRGNIFHSLDVTEVWKAVDKDASGAETPDSLHGGFPKGLVDVDENLVDVPHKIWVYL